MAEGLFRDLVKERSDYEVGSAGVSAYPGQSASQHTAEILKEKGIDLQTFKSRPLTPELINEATHIFAMARHHLDAVEAEFPQASGKLYQVSEFATEDMLRNADVSDPFGGPRRMYEDTRWMLEKLLPTVLAFIEQTWKPESTKEEPK
jgi:protein-tyrosine phosphatase